MTKVATKTCCGLALTISIFCYVIRIIMKKNIKEITIGRNTRIKDIQEEFRLIYPYLAIDFSDKRSEGFFKSRKVNPDNLISNIYCTPGTIKLNVDEERTISEVENEWLELLGLSIQILRKSGNVWNVISITNSWTLQSQNRAGEFISTEMEKAS